MQTRSGKTYTAPSSLKKNNTEVKSNVDNHLPVGFLKPSILSNELAKFLGKPVGSKMPRTAVSKMIIAYINANSLQDTHNGRIINADEKLRKLLKLGKNDELTYFNIQKYMKPHFTRDNQT